MQENPLKQAEPRALTELFSSEPLELTGEEKKRLYAELRKHRENFVVNKKKKKAAGKKVSKKDGVTLAKLGDKGAEIVDALSTDLDDLLDSLKK